MTQIIHYKIKLSMLLCCAAFTAFCQTDVNPTPNINMKTPEVGALLKFLETPVSFSTGLANISIPIYTIEEGDIIYPITVDYNSSGVNLNERAGWVGMNFSINQPQVTRMVRGLPDDHAKGFIKETVFMVNTDYVENQWISAIRLGRDGLIDLESDEYRAILPNGENIRFYFSQDRSTAYPYGEIIQIPHTNNRIIPLFNINLIKGWIITSSDGTIYTFGSGNLNSSVTTYNLNDQNLPILDNKTSGNQNSWMLSKIRSITNELNFFYSSYNFVDCNISDQRRNVFHDDGDGGDAQEILNSVEKIYQKNTGKNYYLKSIEGNFGSVQFILNTNPRADYSYGKMLNEISIFDKNSTKTGAYAFDFTYKTSPAPDAPFISCGTIHNPEDLTKRMFLNKIIILGSLNNLQQGKPFYKFNYSDIILPHRFSYARDWWGYYNGATNNVSLVPTQFRH